MRRPVAFLLVTLFFPPIAIPAWAAQPFDEISVDYPLEGGGLLFYSRLWRMSKHMEAGFITGGGFIHRTWDVDSAAVPDLREIETKTWMFPFVGPRLNLQFGVIGVSLAVAGYYEESDIEGSSVTQGDFEGTDHRWGIAAYTPLFALSYFYERLNTSFALGLGGLLGFSTPTLRAASPSGTAVDFRENPINTLTVTLNARWRAGEFGKERGVEF